MRADIDLNNTTIGAFEERDNFKRALCLMASSLHRSASSRVSWTHMARLTPELRVRDAMMMADTKSNVRRGRQTGALLHLTGNEDGLGMRRLESLSFHIEITRATRLTDLHSFSKAPSRAECTGQALALCAITYFPIAHRTYQLNCASQWRCVSVRRLAH